MVTYNRLYNVLNEICEKQNRALQSARNELHNASCGTEFEKNLFRTEASPFIENILSDDIAAKLEIMNSIMDKSAQEGAGAYVGFAGVYKKLYEESEQASADLKIRNDDPAIGKIENMQDRITVLEKRKKPYENELAAYQEERRKFLADVYETDKENGFKLRNITNPEGSYIIKRRNEDAMMRELIRQIHSGNRNISVPVDVNKIAEKNYGNAEFIAIIAEKPKKTGKISHVLSLIFDDEYSAVRSLEKSYGKEYGDFASAFGKYKKLVEKSIPEKSDEVEKYNGKISDLKSKVMESIKYESKVLSAEAIKKLMAGRILDACENESFMTEFSAVYPGFPEKAKESYVRMTGYKKLEDHLKKVVANAEASYNDVNKQRNNLQKAAFYNGYGIVKNMSDEDLNRINSVYAERETFIQYGILGSRHLSDGIGKYSYNGGTGDLFSPKNLIIMGLLQSDGIDKYTLNHIFGIPDDAAKNAGIDLDSLKIDTACFGDVIRETDISGDTDIFNNASDSLNIMQQINDFNFNSDDLFKTDTVSEGPIWNFEENKQDFDFGAGNSSNNDNEPPQYDPPSYNDGPGFGD